MPGLPDRTEMLEKILEDKVACQIIGTILAIATSTGKSPKEVYEYYVSLGWL